MDVHGISSRVRLDHVISFIDAIFAFSITFMALSIRIPRLASNLTQTELMNEILHLRPQFEIYAISFLIIGVYWISYHQIFNYIRTSHSILIWVNLAFLFFITLISFATSLETVYPLYHVVFLLYAIIITITGSLLAVIWLHASKDRLLIDMNESIAHKGRFTSSNCPTINICNFNSNFICRYSNCSIFLDTHCTCKDNNTTQISVLIYIQFVVFQINWFNEISEIFNVTMIAL